MAYQRIHPLSTADGTEGHIMIDDSIVATRTFLCVRAGETGILYEIDGSDELFELGFALLGRAFEVQRAELETANMLREKYPTTSAVLEATRQS